MYERLENGARERAHVSCFVQQGSMHGSDMANNTIMKDVKMTIYNNLAIYKIEKMKIY
jgi:hypothetical protein